jgi:hypothetical protein
MPDQDESAQAPATGQSSRKKRYLIAVAVTMMLAVGGLFVAGAMVAQRLDPYIREQTNLYLQERFDSEVELEALRIRVPMWAPMRLLLFGGQGALVRIEGDGLSLRHRGRRDLPPMFVVKNFTASADLGTIFSDPKTVTEVTLDGMAVNVPPKAERPALDGDGGEKKEREEQSQKESSVIVEKMIVRNAKLAIFPNDKNKVPLRFDLRDIRLESAGKDVAMKYKVVLTNPKPPGDIESMGTFGPWASGEPGDTPLGGEYLFENADLGSFKGIAGILRSTGNFEGTLSSIAVRGEATVPDFRLKRSENPVPLATTFEALVDGTNGNTVLKPVVAKLGSTDFTTSGVVFKHEGDVRRTVSLHADMPRGSLRDVLRLTMRGSPFIEGKLTLDAQIDIPPLTGTVKEKLQLEGKFEITDGRFLRSSIQSRAKWALWNGQLVKTFRHLADLRAWTWTARAGASWLRQLRTHLSNRVSPAVKRPRSELTHYLDANADSLPDYGARYRAGEPISTAFAESAVNESDRFADWHRPIVQSLTERPAFEQFRNDIRGSLVLANVVAREDVGVVQCCGSTGFLLEPLETFGIIYNSGWENFDRDIPTQASVFSSIHLSHAPRTKEREDLVRAETGARRKRHRGVGESW